MTGVAHSARKGKVIDCSSPSLKPSKQTCPDFGRNLELYGASSLLLNDHRASSYFVARDEGSDFDLHQIAAAELAVDGKIEQRTISHPSRSRKKRTIQIWRCFRGFLTPTCFLRSKPVDPVRQDHSVKYPFQFSSGHHRPE